MLLLTRGALCHAAADTWLSLHAPTVAVQVFAFYGVLGQMIAEPLKMTVWDFDLRSSDDQLGHVDVNLGEHTYCDEIRRDLVADLDTTGEVVIQIWWEPESEEGDDKEKLDRRNRRAARGGGDAESSNGWRALLRRAMCYLVPRKMQTLSGCCATVRDVALQERPGSSRAVDSPPPPCVLLSPRHTHL